MARVPVPGGTMVGLIPEEKSKVKKPKTGDKPKTGNSLKADDKPEVANE